MRGVLTVGLAAAVALAGCSMRGPRDAVDIQASLEKQGIGVINVGVWYEPVVYANVKIAGGGDAASQACHAVFQSLVNAGYEPDHVTVAYATGGSSRLRCRSGE